MINYIKVVLSLSFLVLHLPIKAQLDPYISAYGKEGLELKAIISSLINNHKEFDYTASSIDVWDILKETDKDTANPENVILFYSGRSVNAAQEYNNAKGWTREHVWAKSRGDFGTSRGPGTDIHHLRPVDNSVNSVRNNRNFDECINCKKVIDDGFDTGCYTDENEWTFEPRDEVKGDVARMLFYMAIRYEGLDSYADLELTDELLSKSDKRPLQAKLSTLLLWNKLDPVDSFEVNRNRVAALYQGNRNPFIDYPILVDYIWGDQLGFVWNPTAETDDLTINKTRINIYPNPAKHSINITTTYNKLIIYDKIGREVKSFSFSNKIDISDLAFGIYTVQIQSIDNSISVIKLVIIND